MILRPKKNIKRRDFISKSALGTFSTLIGAKIVHGEYLPEGLYPLELMQINDPIIGKSSKITVLNDRPINAETPAHFLNDNLTPNELFFVRNNGIPPLNIDKDSWVFSVEGESAKSIKTYSINDLKNKFQEHTLNITLECGGNGRSEFNPPAKGNQWTTGAVGCAAWTGVKLKDVLNDVGVKSDAVYIGYYGADTHLSGDPNKDSISRGVPIQKAMEDESMIAYQMNGEDLPILNGHPLRLVFGGMPASCSGKWLKKIVIRDRVHDGAKMGGSSYRVPCETVAPGTKVDEVDMCIIESMPVKSIITSPKTGAMLKEGQTLPLRGHAWTSSKEIVKVEYSIDFGMQWEQCRISNSDNRYAWQHFDAEIKLPESGYYEVWARATDSDGNTQPMLLPGWNPKGYLNNACHRIAVRVG